MSTYTFPSCPLPPWPIGPAADGCNAPTPPPPAGSVVLDTFLPVLNQTAFVLSQAPASVPDDFTVTVNGVEYDETNWSVVGTAFTWASGLFNLGPPDVVLIRYAF